MVWPILSGLITLMPVLGLVVGLREGGVLFAALLAAVAVKAITAASDDG